MSLREKLHPMRIARQRWFLHIKPAFMLIMLASLSLPCLSQQQSSMVFSNALKKSGRMQTAGTVLTAVGGLTFFAGSLMYHKAYDDSNGEAVPEKKTDTAKQIMTGGLACMAVGIPLLTVGRFRERHLRLEAGIMRFNNSMYAGGLGMKLRF